MGIRPGNNCCGNEAGLVQKFIGSAYDVVKGVYENLNIITTVYQLLSKYTVLVCIDDPAELPQLDTRYVKFARIYVSRNGAHIYFDYKYMIGDASGIQTVPPTNGSWVQVNGPGNTSNANIPWVYNNGSSVGGETTITLPSYAVGVSELYIGGVHQLIGINFNYDAATRVITLNEPLDAKEQVIVMIQNSKVNNSILDMGIVGVN